MILHGVDIVEVERVRRAVERWGERFLRRVYTPGELEACDAFAAPRFPSLAARWAAKEAGAKALGTGLSGLGAGAAGEGGELLHFHELEVVRAAHGRPELRLHGGAAALAAALSVDALALSMSHTSTYAVASVVGLAAAGSRPGDGVE
jgi:holo-[acyl-carrier protein] synthase